MEIRDHRRVAKLMLIQGSSQRDLAEALGFKSHSYIGRIMRGEVKSVTPETAARMSKFFGVGVDDLFLVRVSSDNGKNEQRRSA